MIAQLSFDFTAPAATPVAAHRHDFATEDRAHWRIGMVMSLPCFCEVQGFGIRYTQMLPGVVESVDGDLAGVRIYAAPEYGYTLESYPLHLALAIDVPLHALGKYHWNRDLQRLVDEGRLAVGCTELAAAVRARSNFTHERELARVA